MQNKNQDKPKTLEAIAEQWVKLLFTHLHHNKTNKKHIKRNKNNHGK